jgi:hypothetical protein
MAFDLTPAPDGTRRIFGEKEYYYNVASTRWIRIPSIVPNATIAMSYAGVDTNSKVIVGQPVTATITWNRPVSSDEFANSMITFNQSNAANNITNFTLQSTSNSSSVFTFNFSFSGALAQFYIPANSVTIAGNSNLNIYSPVVPGVYLPYVVKEVVQKSTGNSIYTVYSFVDTDYSNTLRYFTVSSTNQSQNQIQNRRIKLSFSNGTGNVSTSGFTTADIDLTAYGTSAGTFSIVGPYTTVTGTTASAVTDVTRYIDLRASNPYNTTNLINKIDIPAGSYLDNNIENDTISPIFLGYFPSSTISVLISSYGRESGHNTTRVKFTIDYFTSFVSNIDDTKITPSNGTIGTLTKDITDTSGTTYYADYTANNIGNYTETIILNPGGFTIPAAANSTSLNGITLTTEPAGSTVVPWNSQRTSIGASTSFPVRNSFAFDSTNPTYPTNGSANAYSSGTEGYSFIFGSLTEFTDTSKRIKVYRDAASNSGGTEIANTSVPYPNNSELNTITSVASGTGAISLGTSTSGATIPVGSVITIPTNWTAGGGLTAGASYFVVSGSSSTYVITKTAGGTAYATTSAPNITNNNIIQITRASSAYTTGGGVNTIVSVSAAGNITLGRSVNFIAGQYFITPANWVAGGGLSASTVYYILSGSGTTYTISATRGGSPLNTSAVSPITNNTISYVSAAGISLPTLEPLTTYYVEMDAGAYRDNYGNLSPAVVTSFTTAAAAAANDSIFNYTNTFVVPAFIRSISAVVVGKGRQTYIPNDEYGDLPESVSGGAGGGLTYRNNISVTPGETLTVEITDFNGSIIKRGSTVLIAAQPGQFDGGGLGGSNDTRNSGYTVGGGNGGAGGSATYSTNNGGGGGGGAGGYSGNGGAGGAGSLTTTPNNGLNGSGGGGGGGSGGTWAGSVGTNTIGRFGGGVGIYGSGSNGTGGVLGAGGNPGSGGVGQLYGGGSGGAANFVSGETAGAGVVRILWGAGRSFPSTNVSSSSS